MTQSELAKACGITIRTVQHYENGARLPKKRETYTLLATDWRLLAGVLFLGLACSCGGYFGFNYVIGKANDPAIAGNVVESMITVIGVAAGIILRGDPFGIHTLIGLAVTLTGVIISSRAE